MTKTRKRILSVTIHREVDTDPDLSWIGEYANQPGPDDRTIDREERGDMGRHEYRYFVAANSGNSGKDTGNANSVEEDYERMESLSRGDWCFVGVYAVAEIQLTGDCVQRVRSGGLWGIESDSSNPHFREIEAEQLAELANELRALGFSARAVKSALDNADRDE